MHTLKSSVMKYGGFIALFACAWCLPGAHARADTQSLDAQMRRVLQPYLAVQALLASDSNQGVRQQAASIAKEAKKLGSQAASQSAERFRALAAEVSGAATELAKATSLEQSRAAFKKLSRPLVQWARRAKPAGVVVVACPMVKGSWLQEGEDVRNPYTGKSMLSCGEVVAGGSKP